MQYFNDQKLKYNLNDILYIRIFTGENDNIHYF